MQQGIATYISGIMPIAVASGLFVSTCSIQRPSGNLTADGTPDGLYVAIAGLQNISCMNAPESNLRITADETKTTEQIDAENSNHVLLSGYYPILEQNTQFQAVVDGVTYQIMGVESDSQRQMTRLKLMIATV